MLIILRAAFNFQSNLETLVEMRFFLIAWSEVEKGFLTDAPNLFSYVAG